jgi:hypothetical protein
MNSQAASSAVCAHAKAWTKLPPLQEPAPEEILVGGLGRGWGCLNAQRFRHSRVLLAGIQRLFSSNRTAIWRGEAHKNDVMVYSELPQDKTAFLL